MPRFPRRASTPCPADDGPVTVAPANLQPGFTIPPPPPGLDLKPSGRFRTTGRFVGDSVPVDAPGPDFFEQLKQGTAPRARARHLRPALPDLDLLCDLCIDGRAHAHLD